MYINFCFNNLYTPHIIFSYKNKYIKIKLTPQCAFDILKLTESHANVPYGVLHSDQEDGSSYYKRFQLCDGEHGNMGTNIWTDIQHHGRLQNTRTNYSGTGCRESGNESGSTSWHWIYEKIVESRIKSVQVICVFFFFFSHSNFPSSLF